MILKLAGERGVSSTKYRVSGTTQYQITNNPTHLTKYITSLTALITRVGLGKKASINVGA